MFHRGGDPRCGDPPSRMLRSLEAEYERLATDECDAGTGGDDGRALAGCDGSAEERRAAAFDSKDDGDGSAAAEADDDRTSPGSEPPSGTRPARRRDRFGSSACTCSVTRQAGSRVGRT
jgi:hypothetical protein